MSNKLFQAREQHGEAFAVKLPSGELVSWRPLTVKEFLHYTELANSGLYPPALLEDEVFCKCVLDEYLVRNKNTLKAGTVSTVAQVILGFSGPHDFNDFRERQAYGRVKAAEIAHELVGHITQAFPAYKPEDVYDMDFETFMIRLGQAERKLMRLGIITEPLTIEPEQTEEKPRKPQIPIDQMAQRFQAQKAPPSPPVHAPPLSPQVSLPFNDRPEQVVISKSEMAPGEFFGDSHDKIDAVLMDDGMVDSTRHIFEEYQGQLDAGGDLVIKTPEERKAAFEKRAKLLEEKYNEAAKELAKRNKKLLQEVEEAKRQKKATKRRRRR